MKFHIYGDDELGVSAALHVDETVDDFCSKIKIDYDPEYEASFFFDSDKIIFKEDKLYDLPLSVLELFNAVPLDPEESWDIALLKPKDDTIINLTPYVVEEDPKGLQDHNSRQYYSVESLEEDSSGISYKVESKDSFFDIDFDD